MIDLIRSGGVPSLVILLFSAFSLVAAVLFARRPDEKSRATIRALINVVYASIALGTLTAFYSVLRFAEAHGEEPLQQVLIVGSAEALTPGILGFALLSVVYMIVAVGERRLNA